MLALGGLVDVLIVDPAPAVAGDLVAQGHARGSDLRVALERHGHAEDRERKVAALELPQDAPDAHPRPVFVDRLHAEMARRVGRCADDLGEKLLGGGVAVQHRALAPLLVVEDELDGDPRVAGPMGVGRASAVADEVAGIGGVSHRSFRRWPRVARESRDAGPSL
jgi:hypothetical protein